MCPPIHLLSKGLFESNGLGRAGGAVEAAGSARLEGKVSLPGLTPEPPPQLKGAWLWRRQVCVGRMYGAEAEGDHMEVSHIAKVTSALESLAKPQLVLATELHLPFKPGPGDENPPFWGSD